MVAPNSLAVLSFLRTAPVEVYGAEPAVGRVQRVYSIVLEEGHDAVVVNGVVAASLGHESTEDGLAHEFWGHRGPHGAWAALRSLVPEQGARFHVLLSRAVELEYSAETGSAIWLRFSG